MESVGLLKPKQFSFYQNQAQAQCERIAKNREEALRKKRARMQQLAQSSFQNEINQRGEQAAVDHDDVSQQLADCHAEPQTVAASSDGTFNVPNFAIGSGSTLRTKFRFGSGSQVHWKRINEIPSVEPEPWLAYNFLKHVDG